MGRKKPSAWERLEARKRKERPAQPAAPRPTMAERMKQATSKDALRETLLHGER